MRGLWFFSGISHRLIRILKKLIDWPAQWIIPNYCPYIELHNKSGIKIHPVLHQPGKTGK
jgi:hypothetical protein